MRFLEYTGVQRQGRYGRPGTKYLSNITQTKARDGEKEKATAKMAQINAANDILSDPGHRLRYDRDPASTNIFQ